MKSLGSGDVKSLVMEMSRSVFEAVGDCKIWLNERFGKFRGENWEEKKEREQNCVRYKVCLSVSHVWTVAQLLI
jgi:hypothetical protein